MVTGNAVPAVGLLPLLMNVMASLLETLKVAALLAKPATVTTTEPLVAPAGTGAVIAVSLQVVGIVLTPLKVTVLDP
jgi:hypothetical protein